MPNGWIGFIIVDAIVTIAVVAWIVSRRARVGLSLAASLPGAEAFRRIAAFARESEPRIVEGVRAGWSGTPEHLPTALTAAVDRLQREALERDLPADRPTLKLLVETALHRHHIGGRALRRAMKEVV